MDNLFLAVAATEEYADILSMESVISYINLVTIALEILVVSIALYHVVAIHLVHKLGRLVNPHFSFIINLVETILWSWIVIMNEAISWAQPDGKINTVMHTLAPIMLGLSAFAAFVDWLHLKKCWKEVGEISLAIASTIEEIAEKREFDNLPFVYPYTEGDGTGLRTDVSRETKAVVAGCNN